MDVKNALKTLAFFSLTARFRLPMSFENYFENVSKAAAFLREKTAAPPKLLLVLSGGLSDFVHEMKNPVSLRSADIPCFPKAKTEGHNGEIIFGNYQNFPIAVMKGRFHYYEGLSPQEVVFPYFVLNELGVKFLVTTNAVGGVRPDLKGGDIMVVTDHINWMGTNPLIGLSVLRPSDQFPSLQRAYDPQLISLAEQAARAQKISLNKGVYLANTGPSYETPAEIRTYRMMGADAVGMSTVFEVIAARFMKMRVLAFNIIANLSADRHPGEMRHDEVLETMHQSQTKVMTLLREVVTSIAKLP